MCDSCQVLVINGALCHEHGCQDAYKNKILQCKWCGSEFTPQSNQDKFCSPCCNAAYNGQDCDCIDCQNFRQEENSHED